MLEHIDLSLNIAHQAKAVPCVRGLTGDKEGRERKTKGGKGGMICSQVSVGSGLLGRYVVAIATGDTCV